MGEYIGRTYINIKEKPLYIIDQKSDIDEI